MAHAAIKAVGKDKASSISSLGKALLLASPCEYSSRPGLRPKGSCQC